MPDPLHALGRPPCEAALGQIDVRRDLAQDDCGVTVTLPDGTTDWFDLVIGAVSVLFAWRDDLDAALREVFGDVTQLVPDSLSQMDDASTERQTWHQMHVERRTSREVTLAGHAAGCLGLPDGDGVSVAIGAAELLGDVLNIVTDTVEALRWWESRLRLLVRHVRRHFTVARPDHRPRPLR
ncbi:MAG TPA: hypothetical protein VF821_34675 [Lentzea sp.]